VILLENSNEWNLFPTKRRNLKKKREQGLKSKRGETSYKEAPCFKRKKRERMKFTSCWERFYRKKEMRSHFPIVQNLMCGINHTHTSFALHYLPFLDFSLSYPLSLHHSPSTMIICHTNSLEFSFAFTIYKV
jgi:hypothetical protein